MSEAVKTLVVDDHPLFARATKALLEQIERIEVIGIASNAKQCLEQVELHQPGLIFLDYQLPDKSGTEVAAEIKRKYPDIHIVIFTGIELRGIFNKLIKIKVSGVLSKESSERTIKNMVNCILEGYTMLPIAFFHQMELTESLVQESFLLVEEEILMMNMLVKGATHDQIADQIFMSKRTVDNYLRKIYDKLGVKSRTEALEKFIKSKYYS
ncbi:response regulator transcription factor [Paenibacillus alba]|uniref:Response regulator transcription factor n=1 Tax=Paenibacillus alba TaxID=1197127 RepID=A0ABU6G373_9BACL|nr:response regulator transcription factor [Paenibacillus alba]MEC0227308.1 response regulator transcription factor [Paenibacillus alba]